MSINKRDAIKAQRTKKKRQQRMNAIMWGGGIIILLVALFASPAIINSLKPVGSFTQITPVARPMENGKSLGNANAKVKIEVYEDFQCTSCKSYSDNIETQLVSSSYITGGQVYYEFMNFPFIDANSITKDSHKAANAAMCALEQGKFWAYHDILFANQGAENGGWLTDKKAQAFAESLGLDMAKFNSCYKADTYSAQIEAEHQKGLAAGVNGTPSVFVNGKEVSPGYIPTYEELKSAIDAALASGG